MTAKLEERLHAAEQKLSGIQKKLQLGSRISLIAGLIIMALIGGYFYYGYSQIKVLLEPDNLVAYGGQMIEDQLPETRKQLEAEVKKNAPAWAEQLSSQLVSAAPNLREGIEDYSLSRTKDIVDELTTLSEAEFRKILKENPKAIELAVKDLKENKNVSEDVMSAVENALENEMRVSIKDQSEQLLGVLKRMKDRLARLHANIRLTEEEELEREILMIVRHLQKKHVNIDPAAKQIKQVIDIVEEPKTN